MKNVLVETPSSNIESDTGCPLVRMFGTMQPARENGEKTCDNVVKSFKHQNVKFTGMYFCQKVV